MEIRLGVLLDEAIPADAEILDDELDETGHVPAAGYRGQHRGRRVAMIGEEALRAAATAVGREVAEVLTGVVAGIEDRAATYGTDTRGGLFDIDDVELRFGVKATLGTGKAIEALLTASGEATVEVTVKLRRLVS